MCVFVCLCVCVCVFVPAFQSAYGALSSDWSEERAENNLSLQAKFPVFNFTLKSAPATDGRASKSQSLPIPENLVLSLHCTFVRYVPVCCARYYLCYFILIYSVRKKLILDALSQWICKNSLFQQHLISHCFSVRSPDETFHQVSGILLKEAGNHSAAKSIS